MQGARRWRFGPFAVDADEHRLTKDGRAMALTHKPFALLVALLERPGELVTKEALFAQVWPGVVVTDAALSRAIRELRVALQDSAVEPRFVATVHGLGFRFVAPVSTAALAAPDAAGACLVGREADIDRLERALAAADAGHRQVVFVSGEAGIGKTALVEAFVERHAAGDASPWVAPGRCIEQYGPGDAHLPVLEALEHLARQAGTAAFVDTFERYAPSWLAHLPWLAREVGARGARRTSADATPQRMLRELAHALDVLSARKTVVLWLEDLHWSDPSSLDVVSFLAGRRDAARLLVIGSLRPGDGLAGAAALRALVLRLTQRGQAQELALQPLDPDAIERYLGLRFGGAPEMPIDALASFVHRRTEGNALFAVSMVDDLVRRGELVESGGRWRLRAGMAGLEAQLPESLRRLVHDQVERLSGADRRVVEAAAVVGASFNTAAAAAALDADSADIDERCAALAQQGRLFEPQPSVSWPDGTVSAGFRFLHALYWQGVFERVPEGRRAQWQRRIGARQETAWGAQCNAIATELAMRFEAAHDIERSLHYLKQAGSAALSRCAYPESIDRLRHGLELAARLPARQHARHELDLLLPLGAALVAAQGYAAADVETVYRRALALCPVCGQPDDLVRALRGQWNVAFLHADLTLAQQAAEQLLAQAESLADPRKCVDAHTKLGQTFLHQGDLRAARRHLEAALAAPGAAADSAVLREAPRVAAYLAWTYWYSGEPEHAARIGDTALDLARRADSPHSSVFAVSHVGWVRLMRGDVELVRSLLDEQHALSREYGFTYWRHYADAVGGVLMLREGRLEEGLVALRQGAFAMQSLGDRIGAPHLLCILAETQLAAGLVGDARLSVDAVSRGIAGNGALYAAEARRVEGLVAQAEGTGPAAREGARRSLESARDIARSQGARALELRAATGLARLLASEHDARRAIETLAPVRAGFSEGLDTEDVLRADELLAMLKAQALAGPLSARR